METALRQIWLRWRVLARLLPVGHKYDRWKWLSLQMKSGRGTTCCRACTTSCSDTGSRRSRSAARPTAACRSPRPSRRSGLWRTQQRARRRRRPRSRGRSTRTGRSARPRQTAARTGLRCPRRQLLARPAARTAAMEAFPAGSTAGSTRVCIPRPSPTCRQTRRHRLRRTWRSRASPTPWAAAAAPATASPDISSRRSATPTTTLITVRTAINPTSPITTKDLRPSSPSIKGDYRLRLLTR